MNEKKSQSAFKVNMPGTTPGTKGMKATPQNINRKPTIRTLGPKANTASKRLEVLEDKGQR